MALFDAAELAELRATWAESLTDRCTIKRLGKTPSAGGGQVEAWTTVATGVPCRVRQALRRQGPDPATGTTHWWELCLMPGQDVRTKDEVVVGTRTYTVLEAGMDSLGVEFVVPIAEVR